MTRSEVERYQRTAPRRSSVPPVGVPASLLPASQGVEERPGRPAERTALRIGLRSLVIAGFAGAAWLLSGAAAHAAGPATPAEPTSGGAWAVSLVNGPGNGAVEEPTAAAAQRSSRQPASRSLAGTASTLLGNVFEPADRATSVVLSGSTTTSLTPITRARPASQPGGTSGSAVPRLADRVVAASAVTHGGNRGTGYRSTGSTAGGGLLALVDQLAAPLRSVDAPAGSSVLIASVTTVVDPIIDPLVRARRPVTDLLRDAAAPVTAALGPATAAVTGKPSRHRPADAAGPDSGGVPAGTSSTDGVAAVPGSAVDPAPRLDGHRPTRPQSHRVTSAKAGPVSDGTGTRTVRRHSVGAVDRTDGSTAARTGTDPAPERPERVPLRAHLGCGSGVSTSGSGSPSDGGAFATVASSVAGSTVAYHRLPITTDVAVRRHDAEAPTVSPD